MDPKFCWNELITPDAGASSAFYSKLFGWKTEAFNKGADYVLFKNSEENTGGMMKMPDGPSHWLPYVVVTDCEASVRKAESLGARIAVPAKDIPTIGRIAVLVDPQGAALGIIKPIPQ